MSTQGLLKVLTAGDGELDSWLEKRSEDEIRKAIQEIAQPQETLRDYFAAKFAAGWITSMSAIYADKDVAGKEANRLGLQQADEMLAARNAP